MKKIIKLTESDLEQIIQKVLNEQANTSATAGTGFRDIEDINPKKLKIGDGGNKNPKLVPYVKILQQKLMDLGILKTKSMTPTGYFGNLTQAALNTYNSKGNVVKKTTTTEPKKTTTTEPKKTTTTEPKKTTTTEPKKTYNLTPRIDQELSFIKQRGLDDKPFFIYDPKDNLIYLFNQNSKLVDYSSVVDGADIQKEKEQSKSYTIEDWCKTSGLDVTPFRCTDPSTKTKKDPYYSVLSNLKSRFLPKGIYSISTLYRHEGYEGTGQNTFQLVDNNGKTVSAAIHGIPSGLAERLKASKDLEYLLKKDLSLGKVPEKYLSSIKTISNANQSFGCIGVPAKFIDNPNVKGIAKGARVFVMGESGKSFLVQNSDEFFKNISGDGENCVNPESVAAKMSSMA